MWQEIEKIFENLIANIDVLLFGLLKILLIFVGGHLLKRILCAAIKKSLNRRAAKNPHSLSAKKYGTVITLTQSVMRYLIDFIMLVMLLDVLGLEPVITAHMCLGEGTGAVALLPLLDMALAVYEGMSTFQEISIESYQPLD